MISRCARLPLFALLLPLLLGGCSMSVLKQPMGVFSRDSKPKTAAKEEAKPVAKKESKKKKEEIAVAKKQDAKKHEKTSSKKQKKHEEQREEKRDAFTEARDEMALAPKEPYWAWRLAELYTAADSLPQAERALEASLAREPAYAPALALRSKQLYESGRFEEAVKMLEAARSRDDAFPNGMPEQLLAGLALHYDALDRPDLADAVLASVPRRDPKGARSASVYVTLRGSHPDSASALARIALDDDSRSAVNQNNYGITRLRAGDPEAARKAFLSAIDRDPKLAGPYYNLAILEKFYLFDDKAAGRWFSAYRERSTADPDSLRAVFDANERPNLTVKED
jgi:tetratricopeptide (TPR) repeat protein